MRLLHAGVDTTVIALWLGHEQVETTQMYLHADLAIKERALARTKEQTSGIGGRNGGIPAAAFLSPRVFARLCIRADPWAASAEGAGGERDNDRGDESDRARGRGRRCDVGGPAAGVRRCWRW